VAERPEVGFGEYPGRGGTASAQCMFVPSMRDVLTDDQVRK
jgi:hypothetical protein